MKCLDFHFSDMFPKGDETKKDHVLTEIWKQVRDKKMLCRIRHFLIEQEVDTDCIEDDVEVFEEENYSNLFEFLGGVNEAFHSVRDFLRHQRIMSTTFATGYSLFYWEWYRTATEKDVTASRLDLDYELRGHTVQELSVDAHFKDIKEEVFATGLVSPEDFEDLVVQKAMNILKCSECRKLRSNHYGGGFGWDPWNFGISRNIPVSLRHIISLILYTDFTELCTLFSKSMRKHKWNDKLKDIKKRNSKFYHFSKSLRELVTYFGSNGGGYFADDSQKMNGKVTGPFFSGVSVVLNLSRFTIGFHLPTSTSKTKEIAWRFAGEEGMVIRIGNGPRLSRIQPLFNATWISAFVEEDEHVG